MTTINKESDRILKALKKRSREKGFTPPKKEKPCKKCNGYGWVGKRVPVGDPDFGKAFPCGCKSSWSSVSGISKTEFETYTWDKILDEGDAKLAEKAIKETLKTGYGWVYLWGGPGIAKTVLLKVATAESIQKRNLAIYISMDKIIDNLREAYDTEYPNVESISRLAKWADIPVLAIDEFDKVKLTEYAETKQFRLMDDRYQAVIRNQGVTLMASNEPPENIGSYLSDRILDGRFKVIHMRGESLRPAMDWESEV